MKPWHPPYVAPHYPLPPGRKFFEGQGIGRRKKVKGRATELQSLTEKMDTSKDGSSYFGVSGVGGIGKTATMLEVAQQQANKRNVFLIQANNQASLHQAYLNIARRIGPDYLLSEFRGQDLQQIWRNKSDEEEVERFKTWLGDPVNKEAILLLDGMDGFRELEDRIAALPDEARTIVYTTRDPVFNGAESRKRLLVRVTKMPQEEIIELMEEVRDSESNNHDSTKAGDIYNRDTLLQVAAVVDGHPLAASIARKYIIRVLSHFNALKAGEDFVARFKSDSLRERREFLDFAPELPSILETFYVSKNRLKEPEGPAWKLMQIYSLLETRIVTLDPRKFFFDRFCSVMPESYPDYEIFGAESFHLRGLFSELERVSFGERGGFSARFDFHPLWLECARQAMGEDCMKRYAREILQICCDSIFNCRKGLNILEEEQRTNEFIHHALHCKQVCSMFRLGLHQLQLLCTVASWINSDLENGT